MNIIDLNMPALAKALDEKKLSSEEVTKHYLDRIDKYDSDIKSYLHVAGELAINEARKQDELRARGNAAKGAGIPVALKDLILTTDMPTTCASKALQDFYSPYNATIVDNLRTKGYVLLGKLNMDQFAMGSSGESSYYKTTVNPWDYSRVPGGSSSGSAAAMAARLAPATLGSDTGGSIRQPSSYCGVVGYKPTYGMVSRYGAVPYASSLDQLGPITKCVEDAAYIMDTLASHDPKDPTSVAGVNRSFYSNLDENIKGIKIGVPNEYFTDNISSGVKETVLKALDVFRSLGAEIVPIEMPRAHMGLAVYQAIANAEVSSNLARFDGIEFGYCVDNAKDLNDLYCSNRSVFGSEVKKRVIHGTYILQSKQYKEHYMRAAKVRTLIAMDYTEAFQKCDFIAGPTASTIAFSFMGNDISPMEMSLNDLYTVTLNLNGSCGVSVPCGFYSNMPVGLQLQGKAFDDQKLLSTAYAYQQATGWHKMKPEIAG